MSLDGKIGGKKRARPAGTTKQAHERLKAEKASAPAPRSKKPKAGIVWSNILVVIMVAMMLATVVRSIGLTDDVMSMMTARENSQRIFKKAKDGAKEAEAAFVNERTFEVPYGNVDEVLGLLEGVSGITVNSVMAIDPKQGFAEVGTQTEVNTYGAARITLTVADVTTALRSLDKAQLAINTLETSGNTITLDIVLKGVESW